MFRRADKQASAVVLRLQPFHFLTHVPAAQ
jgi:hypothetical protein